MQGVFHFKQKYLNKICRQISLYDEFTPEQEYPECDSISKVKDHFTFWGITVLGILYNSQKEYSNVFSKTFLDTSLAFVVK